MLANVDRLGPERAAAIGAFVESGGGLLIAPGDRLIAGSTEGPTPGSPPRSARSRATSPKSRPSPIPAPRTFAGPALAPLGQGDNPPLAQADFFAYRVLEPEPGASVVAGLDTGDPWIVERAVGKGRVALLSTPIDAEGGTLPVNPDFVPFAHELIAHLAAGAEGPRSIKPGEPLEFPLDPPPPPNLKTLTLTTPSGIQGRRPDHSGPARPRRSATPRPASRGSTASRSRPRPGPRPTPPSPSPPKRTPTPPRSKPPRPRPWPGTGP